jgi:hypothetical protein
LIQLYRWLPSILQVLTIIRPETLVRWHRAGFRCYWRWTSRPLGWRPQIDTELRALIRRMSMENPLWGALRIHGELLKFGFEVAQSSVARYMVKRRGPPGQGWRIFLRNHAPDIAAMDLFVVPTIGFDLLYAFVIVCLDHQITEVFPWNEAPRYLIRDRDRIYGSVVTCRRRAMGIRDRPTAPASPWQNGFAERLIGSIRRECVNHIIVLGEMHLRRVLKSYADCYNCVRTHRSLDKANNSRFERLGSIHGQAPVTSCGALYPDRPLYGNTGRGDRCRVTLPRKGRSFVNLDHGIFYRKPIGKRATKKRQTPAPIPPRLLTHLRRWKSRKLMATCFVEFNGKPVASVKRGFQSAVRLASLPGRVTPHTLRHTAATWLMQHGVPI